MARSRTRRGSPRARVLLGILLGTACLLLLVAMVAYLLDGNWRRPASELIPQMGRLNYLAASWTLRGLGAVGGWLLPLALGAGAARLLLGRRIPGTGPRGLLLAATALALAASVLALPGGDLPPGRAFLAGALGRGIVAGLRLLFGGVGAGVVLGGATLAFLAGVGIPIFAPLTRLGPRFAAAREWLADGVTEAAATLRDLFTPAAGEPPKRERARTAAAERPGEEPPRIVRAGATPGEEPEEEWDEEEAEQERESGSEEEPAEVPVVVLPPAGDPAARRPQPTSVEILTEIQTDRSRPYQFPPKDFLDRDPDDGESPEAREELLAQAKVLEKALRDFGVKGKVTQVQPGPVITRYEIEPAPGQKVAPIAGLSDDLALALRARQIRVVAPIPGKAAVGIEVPNPEPRIVRLGSLLETKEYTGSPSLLNIALGRTISGEPFCVALDRLPHLLVAGSTGSGKSVCINTIIASIVYRAGPEDVRFIMVDPKMLELTTYVGLPHLVPPVVSQAKDVVKILKWVVSEMESRYRALAHVGVRNIADHNRRLVEEGAPKLPYLLVIVDELADLMLSNVRGEIEEAVARLAQMARAVGIHLVVATQRPSVDVITGVIKANFPSRIAFQVPTRTDSRTILDSMGAERLLGKGDMLYLGVGMSEPVRVHGAFISTEETNDIVEWLKTRNPPAEADEEGAPLDEGADLFPMDREDDLFEEAARILVAHQQGSISLLQRRLKVGYARAARLVDMMEEAGIVGPFTGSKAREILVPTLEELERRLAQAKSSPLGGRTSA